MQTVCPVGVLNVTVWPLLASQTQKNREKYGVARNDNNSNSYNTELPSLRNL